VLEEQRGVSLFILITSLNRELTPMKKISAFALISGFKKMILE